MMKQNEKKKFKVNENGEEKENWELFESFSGDLWGLYGVYVA